MAERNNRLFRDPNRPYPGAGALTARDLRSGLWNAITMTKMDDKFCKTMTAAITLGAESAPTSASTHFGTRAPSAITDATVSPPVAGCFRCLGARTHESRLFGNRSPPPPRSSRAASKRSTSARNNETAASHRWTNGMIRLVIDSCRVSPRRCGAVL
jgi:hypothetical protein